MKKIVSLVLIFTMVMTIAIGCSDNKAELADGVYSAEGEFDERGWKSTITITVENGKIEDVDYDEVTEDGSKKSEDDEYAQSMKGVSGVTPEEAYEQLEDALESSQNVDKVDAVSGATSSSEQFKNLANEALNKE